MRTPRAALVLLLASCTSALPPEFSPPASAPDEVHHPRTDPTIAPATATSATDEGQAPALSDFQLVFELDTGDWTNQIVVAPWGDVIAIGGHTLRLLARDTGKELFSTPICFTQSVDAAAFVDENRLLITCNDHVEEVTFSEGTVRQAFKFPIRMDEGAIGGGRVVAAVDGFWTKGNTHVTGALLWGGRRDPLTGEGPGRGPGPLAGQDLLLRGGPRGRRCLLLHEGSYSLHLRREDAGHSFQAQRNTSRMNEPSNDPANLELSPVDMQAMGNLVVARSVAHLAALDESPILGDYAEIETLCRSLREDAPDEGTALEALIDSLFDDWIPRSFGTPHSGYMAFIPGGGVYPAALADFIADATNRYTGVWQAAPALVQLEANALDWLRDWMQFPKTTRGLFTTGGSMAMFNAIACAREKLLGHDIRSGTLYVTSQTHHCIVKAARLAGIAHDRVRVIDVDADFRMCVDALDGAIAADRAAGLKPFMVFSTAGTTNTGAVDPIEAVADIAAREQLWHHVDGAYGGFFHMVPELRPLLAGLPRADSLTLDPHKGMFMPYGTGALLVRDGEALRALHSSTAGYLPDNQSEFYDPAQYGPDLSRGFPGLRIWLTVKFFGAARYRAALAEKRELATWAADEVARIPGIVMDALPQLSLFAFHLESRALGGLAAQNAATRALMDRVTARGQIMLTGAMVSERFLGRVCVLSFRTRREQMATCVRQLAEESAALLAEAEANTPE